MKKKLIFAIILIIVFASAAFLFFFFGKKEVSPDPFVGGVLNIFNWEDYLSEEVVSEFEKEHGIKANVDFFEDSDDVLVALREDPESILSNITRELKIKE